MRRVRSLPPTRIPFVEIKERAPLPRGCLFIYSQLRFASGSLAQFLDIRYSAKVPSSSTLDDVRGALEKWIPDSYFRTESEFLARVEEDAVSFRPHGEKIASYTRVAPNSEKRGKGAAVVTLPEDDPDAIVYEVWHVRCVFSPLYCARMPLTYPL